jgi:hypothetical protein
MQRLDSRVVCSALGVARLVIVLVCIGLSIASSARVVFIPVLVPDLASALSATILPALGKALVQIGPNDALVELGAANVLHAVERVLVRVVLDEAEAAGCLLEAVKAHDEAFDLAAFAEQLVDLFLGCVEGEVADVERGCIFELVFGLGRGLAVVVVAVAVASSLLGKGLARPWSCSCLGSGPAPSSYLCRCVGARLVQTVDCASESRHHARVAAIPMTY